MGLSADFMAILSPSIANILDGLDDVKEGAYEFANGYLEHTEYIQKYTCM